MFNFLIPIFIVGVICLTFYGMIELFVRKKERLSIIEKIGDKLDPSMIEGKFKFPKFSSKISFSTLKIACLLIGLGLGFIVGFILDFNLIQPSSGDNYRAIRDMREMVYIASVLLFGGISLIVAFFIEKKSIEKERKEEKE